MRFFFHQQWQLTGQQWKGEDHPLFHSTTSTPSWTFSYLFATLHVRWLSHIFNHNACIYQTGSQWNLPSYWITFWLINDVMLIFICLLIDMILDFVTAIIHMRNWWTQTRIDYHPCITSELTNQVCYSPQFITLIDSWHAGCSTKTKQET